MYIERCFKTFIKTRNVFTLILFFFIFKQIIDRLIENSASFGTKTEFSQEKYIMKKKHKYLAIYEILRPSVRILINFYMQGTMKRKIL